MAERNPFRDYLGNRGARRTGPEGGAQDGGRGWVAVYRAVDQGINPEDGGPWAIICETHKTLLQVDTLADARSVMAYGSQEFCDCCRGTCGFSEVFRCPSCFRGGPRPEEESDG